MGVIVGGRCWECRKPIVTQLSSCDIALGFGQAAGGRHVWCIPRTSRHRQAKWPVAALCLEQALAFYLHNVVPSQHLVRPEVMEVFERTVARNRELLERLAKWMLDFLTVAEVYQMQSLLIESFGGMHGVRDKNAIESAVFRPQTGYYNSLAEEAVALMESLGNNHGFIDGNKESPSRWLS